MSILNNNKPVAHLGRSSFDLSSTHALSMRPAVLRPVIVQDTVPDSAFRINATDLVRTTSLQTAAFLRGKHELDFFFVPYNLVYSFFNDMVLERGDLKSPIVNEIKPEYDSLPTLPLEHLFYNAAIPYIVERHLRYAFSVIPSADIAQEFQRLLSNIGNSSSQQQHFMNMCLYNSFTFQDAMYDLTFYSFIGYDVLALMDTLGFGNFGSSVVSALDDYYNNLDRQNFDIVDNFEEVSDNLISDLICSYFANRDFDRNSFSSGKKLVNPLRFFAYQKIFYDRYRDEVFDNDPLYAYAISEDFDFDVLSSNPTDLSDFGHCPLDTFLRPRVRMVKKDIVSGLYPSAQFGDIAEVSDFSELSDLKVQFTNPPSQPHPINQGANNIRYVLAMQKYRETLLRAGSRSKDVLKAMFGVESRYIDDTYVRYLGSFSGQLELNKVSATADTGTYSVGDLAGNVFSSLQGNTIEFTCNDFGVIIGVMSFFPELLHNNFGVSPHVLKSRPLHFFKSQFEDLGLQPVSSSIVNLNTMETSGQESHEITLGFSARYNEYKQNLDFSHDQFCSANFRFLLPDFGGAVNSKDGFNTNYVVNRSSHADVSLSSLRNYLLPDCMDSLFTAQDTGDISNYHFDVILDCRINAVLPMSNLGLPY